MTYYKQPAIVTGLWLAAAVTGAQADDGFKLTDKLSVSGFIDMSSVYVDADGQDSVSSTGLDQVELNLLYTFSDKLTAQVDIEYDDDGNGKETDIEQAFFSYALSDQLSLKAGRFLSYSGWETQEPTGLFQYSGTGYAKYFYGGYQQGVSAAYNAKSYALAMSVVSDIGDLKGEASDTSNPAFELMAAIMPSDSVTVKGFYITDKLDGSSETSNLLNLWASYADGPLTLAAEYNQSENAPAAGAGVDADGYLLMANYAFDKWALTFRYHHWELDQEMVGSIEEYNGFTIAPSFNITENLLIVTEYRFDEDKISGADINTFAVEALLSF
ncbi:MAG: porin [Cellvibrionaceae bacterium]|nr:porin [Cellvibrionaceae bacterium]MCV6627067.1 porin [Cellvibrionaceae bacterium]